MARVEFAGGGNHGFVTARTSAGAALYFQVRNEAGHWWLALEPVERAD